jgi:two-component system NtrC family sensor kinase
MIFAVLVTAAHAMSVSIQQWMEARLLRQQRRYQTFLLHVSQWMIQIRALRSLLKCIVHVVTRAVGLTHAAMFLGEPGTEGFRCAASRYAHGVATQAFLPGNDPLVLLLTQRRQPVVLDELTVQVGESRWRKPRAPLEAKALLQMQTLGASVVVPSVIQDRLIGFVVLGEKRNGRLFTSDDLTVFSTLANQAAIAIENARFYEAERQRQAALFHAASLAALGTMASSMGHQVNNRFSVVSIIAATQKLKLEHLLHQSPRDPQALQRALTDDLAAFDSLEDEARRGGQIVASLRKLTQPLGQGYGPVSLDAAIQRGLSLARYTEGFGALHVSVQLPPDLPQVRGDATQLGECVDSRC